MKNRLITSLAGICLLITPNLLHAQLNISATIGGVPNFNPATVLNFDGSLPSNLTLNNAYQVSGFNGGVIYVQPYFSGTTASYFGENPTTGADNTQYIAVYGGGTATFNFSTPQSYFGLLWGSIGQSDSLSFYNGSTLIGIASPTNFLASTADFGSWGADGTYYVNISSSTPFTEVVATTGANCFEMDDVAYAPVPEPGTCALAGVGLGALALVRRKMRAQQFGRENHDTNNKSFTP